MSERDNYPAGVPCWVDTAQHDVDAGVDFYAALFGWEFAGPGPITGDSQGRYYVARVRGRDVAGVSTLPPGGAVGWNTHVAVDSADGAAERVERSGGTVLVGPFDVQPAGRMAVFADPAGATFFAWEGNERAGAQIVNEPSAWAMSMLNTPDLESSASFYREVFGWDFDPFDLGETEIMLLRLPGYVGGEPDQPVPRDVVAVMAPLGDAAEPHWSVDFWVRDADRAVASVAERGGTVLAGPFDTPAFRSAAIADPQGASFSISQLKGL